MSLSELRKQVKEKGIPYTNTMNQETLEDFLSDGILLPKAKGDSKLNRKYCLGWRWSHIQPFLQTKKDFQSAVNALLSPVRDFSKIQSKTEKRKLSKFLSEHRVVITMTTSPTRLPKITAVLATLDLTFVSRINVVLPMEYGSKKETYDNIPENVVNFPKVKIVRIKKDMGPITKMLPTITRAHDKQKLVISIDDDVAYPMGMINELIYQKVCKFPNSAITMGVPMPFFTSVKNMKKYWPENHQRRPYIDIVEGWSSIIYSPKNVNPECMVQLTKLSKQCLLSDDFVISYALAQANIKRAVINNKFAFNPAPYDYGTGEDALHAGRDLEGGKRKYIPNSDIISFEKYSDCLKNIQEYVRLIKEQGHRKDSERKVKSNLILIFNRRLKNPKNSN